jgi:hypothetical protein
MNLLRFNFKEVIWDLESVINRFLAKFWVKNVFCLATIGCLGAKLGIELCRSEQSGSSLTTALLIIVYIGVIN